MKKIFTTFVSLVLFFGIVGSVYAENMQVNYEYSSALVTAAQLDKSFVGVVGVDGELLVLDQHKALENGISFEKIKEAKEKIKEYNKITKDALAISPFITFNGNKIHFNEKEAEKKGVSKELINATNSDIEKINKAAENIYSIAACEGASKFVDR